MHIHGKIRTTWRFSQGQQSLIFTEMYWGKTGQNRRFGKKTKDFSGKKNSGTGSQMIGKLEFVGDLSIFLSLQTNKHNLEVPSCWLQYEDIMGTFHP